MADQRLPIVNGDDGQWGTILNQYLEKEHYNTGLNDASNGMHKTVTIRAGTATAATAPLKFTSGTSLTAPEAGAMEFTTDSLFFTTTTGPTRKTIAWTDGTNFTYGTPGTIAPDDTASAGTADSAARSDHRHSIDAAAASATVMGDAAAEGSSTSFARADHAHDRSSDAALFWMGATAI